jgi:hypothetical protein
MKKKVKMICILKSGAVVEDTIKVDKKNTRAFRVIDEMRKGIENSLGYEKPAVQNITFGKLTVAVSEIAAIKFKEN